jgi:hypothetical protein
MDKMIEDVTRLAGDAAKDAYAEGFADALRLAAEFVEMNATCFQDANGLPRAILAIEPK